MRYVLRLRKNGSYAWVRELTPEPTSPDITITDATPSNP